MNIFIFYSCVCRASEPMSLDNKLFSLDNYITTPHMAWYSEEAAKELNRKVAEETVRFFANKPLHYKVNTL